MFISMKIKFDKYLGSLKITKNMLMVTWELDPRYKFGYINFLFERFFGVKKMTSKIRPSLDELYDYYKSLNLNLNSLGSNSFSR